MGRMFGIVLIVLLPLVLSLSGGVARAEVMTLEQCIQRALETNGSSQYGLPQAKEGYHRSKQGVWTAWGLLLPSLSHSYSHRYTKFPSSRIYDPTTGEFIESPGGSSTSWSTDFSLRQTIFDGGANMYRVTQAYHNRAANAENLRGAENGLVLGVKESYFELLKSQQLVGVQEAAVKRAEQFHKTIESKYELGSASLSEVLKAKVQLGTEQLTLLQRQNDVLNNRARLNTIINRRVDEPLEVAEVSAEGPASPTYDEALQTALKESPDVLGAQANVRSAKNDLGIARSTLFPTLSWNASRSFTPESKSDILDFDGAYGTWSAGLSLSFNLFDAFHWKTDISNARVGLKYAKETERQTEMAVELAVKQAYLGVELANESRRLAEQTAESAQEDFNLAQEKYNLGAATILDLLDAQASLTRAQTDRVNALYDQYVAVARLENATGRR